MPENALHRIPLWPLLLYATAVALLLAVILTLSYLLGQHHRDRATGKPYEGGIEQTGSARIRFSAQFYLVAMLFVVFDVEAVFIMLWALGFYELGWPGYIGAAVFIGQLAVVLVYEWGIGALDIGADVKKIMKVYRLKQRQQSNPQNNPQQNKQQDPQQDPQQKPQQKKPQQNELVAQQN